MVEVVQTIVLVGLMGAGKSSIGRRLAARLDLPFTDADAEIEEAAGCTVAEIFERFGEEDFRNGERKVIARLLDGEPRILATGGGAFMNTETRTLIKERGISVWLKADLDTLFERTSRKDTRPLLKQGDPKEILQRLIDERYPVYAEADITVDSKPQPHEVAVEAVVRALATFENRDGTPE